MSGHSDQPGAGHHPVDRLVLDELVSRAVRAGHAARAAEADGHRVRVAYGAWIKTPGGGEPLTYISAIVFSLLIWATAEGFGGPYTSGASDIGTAIIYAVVFAGLLAINYYSGPSRYSADYYLERRYSWWWRLAEMRRPAPPEPVSGPVASLPRPRLSA